MTTMGESRTTKFHSLLHDQIRNEFNASHQYIATAIFYDNADLPQLAKHFYAQAVEERNHAMMIVQYFLDRDIAVDLTGVDAAQSMFESAREPIALALEQEKAVTEQIVELARTAREEGDYLASSSCSGSSRNRSKRSRPSPRCSPSPIVQARTSSTSKTSSHAS